jgi:hypothetical protein
MKAVIVAAAMTLVLLLVVTLAFGLRPSEERAKQMTLIYFGCAVVATLAWFITPDGLGFLAPSLLIEPRWLDLSLMLFFFSSAFFGGVLQLYNLADRGFSLRILIDLDAATPCSGGVDALVKTYGGGQGLTWMYGKRLHGLLAGDFVRRNGDAIELTARGWRTAEMFDAAHRFLRLDTQS